jgi:hypothetical protein
MSHIVPGSRSSNALFFQINVPQTLERGHIGNVSSGGFGAPRRGRYHDTSAAMRREKTRQRGTGRAGSNDQEICFDDVAVVVHFDLRHVFQAPESKPVNIYSGVEVWGKKMNSGILGSG